MGENGKGIRRTHADDIEGALRVLRSGRGADLLMVETVFAQPVEVLTEGLRRLEAGLTEYRRTMARQQKIA